MIYADANLYDGLTIKWEGRLKISSFRIYKAKRIYPCVFIVMFYSI